MDVLFARNTWNQVNREILIEVVDAIFEQWLVDRYQVFFPLKLTYKVRSQLREDGIFTDEVRGLTLVWWRTSEADFKRCDSIRRKRRDKG